ncbi:MAG: tyrosine-protein kinase family protein [Ardenticatenaceae bacterium]
MKRNRMEIRAAIIENLQTAGWPVDDLRVQPDPFIGWLIVVVSSGFDGKSQEERKKIVLAGLDELHIEWIEMLTPVERQWAGPLPTDSDLEDLPLWPEALARGRLANFTPPAIVFPSDLDQDIEPPIVVTFYSQRGGVGRSTALAYTGRILAARGKKVVCVDMDIEAPGLAALFGREQDIKEGYDLVHLLVTLDQEQEADISKYLLRISESDDLYCLPAGRLDANYARLLQFIAPSAWYRDEYNPLRVLMEQLTSGLPFTPDVILFDAATGVTPFSGPLLFDFADLSVVVFFPHPQTKTGTGALVQALLAAHTRRELEQPLAPEPRFLVSPIPTSKAPEVVRRYKQRGLKWVAEWLSILKGQDDGRLIESEITHFVPYREVIATSDTILSARDVWRDYEPVAEWIEGFLPTESEKLISKSLAPAKQIVLQELHFSAGTAERQKDFLDTFLESDLFKKALDPKNPLVLGRKGTGKTAVFRRLAEDNQKAVIVVTAPALLSGDRGWLLNVEGFRDIAEVLKQTGADWRQFWTFYTALAVYFSPSETSQSHSDSQIPKPKSNFADELINPPASQLDVVELTKKFFGGAGRKQSTPSAGLIANDWLVRLDRVCAQNTLLLFDGLDTGFGSSDDDRVRRREALEGLFAFFTDQGDGLNHLRFKIMLREDIWRRLKFENKSHLFGRTVNLKYTDQTSFFKVVLKQALRSQTFKSLLPRGTAKPSELEYWGERDVWAAWHLLVSERMKGAKAAFSRNWVWNRLADSNGDHTPRYLLQLMHQAREWEQQTHQSKPYERSIIRPRGLIEVLPEVSVQALSALRDEEFPELQPLMNELTQIGRTPVDANDLSTSQELINLAREVGLLEVYESSGDYVVRYKVPEIYRYALKMTRKGQA